MSNRRKILVVDDNEANLKTCKAILKDTYDIFTALSAESMFSLLEDITPDLIMLDIRMPGMDGYEAMKTLKNNETYKDIPIIFLTAIVDVESEMEGLELGAVDYISKPYFPPVLIRRIEMHLDLVDKTKKLEQISQAKSNFLANMSHEMRTPLTAVLGLTELILNTVQFDDETYSILGKIYRAGETLLELINDILDVSKIEADSFTVNPARYDVSTMLGDAVGQSMMYIDSKPIKFTLDIDENMPKFLFGDALRVKQVLNNLLSNAFKYTHTGSVEMSLQCEPYDDSQTWLIIKVTDTGIGVRQEDIGRLFTTYSRMEDLQSRKTDRITESTGLGLYITKKIVTMMGGRIDVESQYGKGSCFTARVRQKLVSSDVIGKNTADDLINLNFYADEFRNADKTRTNMSYAKVLIADDNIANLDVARSLIGLYGIKTDCVTDGRQAIDAVRSENVRYDAIFMDHIMPEMDGIEAVKSIRRDIATEYAKKVPIIALTANALVGNEEVFLDSGFQAYLPKPIELARLDTILNKWVRDEVREAQLAEKTITIRRKTIKNHVLRKGIKGLDIPKGIDHFGSNEEVYIKVLQSFAKNMKPLLETIKNVNSGNLGEYSTTIHGIKGAAFGIFAHEIGSDAEALEHAAKAGDINFVAAKNPDILIKIKQLIADIDSAHKTVVAHKKPFKDKPDEALMARFLDACKSYDIDKMDSVMEEINKFEYTDDGGLAEWLRTRLEQGSYNEIKDRLS